MTFRPLIIDIETSPSLVYTFDLHGPYLGPEHIVKPGGLLCFSAKFLGESNEFHRTGPDRQHRKMLDRAHALLSEADAVIHFNGTTFDVPVLNAEFALFGMSPPPPTPHIDLLQTIRHKFRMVSSKLAFVGPYLRIGEKVKHTGFELWRGCMDDDKDSWKLMEKYNREDTDLTERLYKKLLPWIDRHPNRGMYTPDGCDIPVCPNCGEKRLQSRGFQRALKYTYRRLYCAYCGHWCRDNTSIKAAAKPSVRNF